VKGCLAAAFMLLTKIFKVYFEQSTPPGAQAAYGRRIELLQMPTATVKRRRKGAIHRARP
jgi:hypothetical protein